MGGNFWPGQVDSCVSLSDNLSASLTNVALLDVELGAKWNTNQGMDTVQYSLSVAL